MTQKKISKQMFRFIKMMKKTKKYTICNDINIDSCLSINEIDEIINTYITINNLSDDNNIFIDNNINKLININKQMISKENFVKLYRYKCFTSTGNYKSLLNFALKYAEKSKQIVICFNDCRGPYDDEKYCGAESFYFNELTTFEELCADLLKVSKDNGDEYDFNEYFIDNKICFDLSSWQRITVYNLDQSIVVTDGREKEIKKYFDTYWNV